MFFDGCENIDARYFNYKHRPISIIEIYEFFLWIEFNVGSEK